MTTHEIIKKALQILKQHDFYWMMNDYAYTNGEREKAKANMRSFVKTIKALPSEVSELMKKLWIAEYNYCGCFRPFSTSDEAPIYKKEKEKLYAEVDAIISPLAMVA